MAAMKSETEQALRMAAKRSAEFKAGKNFPRLTPFENEIADSDGEDAPVSALWKRQLDQMERSAATAADNVAEGPDAKRFKTTKSLDGVVDIGDGSDDEPLIVSANPQTAGGAAAGNFRYPSGSSSSGSFGTASRATMGVFGKQAAREHNNALLPLMRPRETPQESMQRRA